MKCSLSAVTGEKVGHPVSRTFLITTSLVNNKKSRSIATFALSSPQSRLCADIASLTHLNPLHDTVTPHVKLHLSTMAHTKPSPEETLNLFKDIEESFPSANLGEDKWYILAVSLLPIQDI